MWVALLKSLECGCLSTIGLQRDDDDGDDEKTTVRSVPDGSDNQCGIYHYQRGSTLSETGGKTIYSSIYTVSRKTCFFNVFHCLSSGWTEKH